MRFKTLKESEDQRNERRSVSGALTEFMNYGPMPLMQDTLKTLLARFGEVLERFRELNPNFENENLPIEDYVGRRENLVVLTELPQGLPSTAKALNALINILKNRENNQEIENQHLIPLTDNETALKYLKVIKILKVLVDLKSEHKLLNLGQTLNDLTEELKKRADWNMNLLTERLNQLNQLLNNRIDWNTVRAVAEEPILEDINIQEIINGVQEADIPQDQQQPLTNLKAFLNNQLDPIAQSPETMDLARLQIIVSKVRDEVLKGLMKLNTALCQLDEDWYEGLNNKGQKPDENPRYLYFYLKGGNAYKGANLRQQLDRPLEERRQGVEVEVFPEVLGDSDFDSQVIINPSLPLSLQKEIIAHIEEISTYYLQETANNISEVIEKEWVKPGNNNSSYNNTSRKEDMAQLVWQVLSSCKGNGLLKGQLHEENVPLQIQDAKTLIAALPSQTGVRLDMLDANWSPGLWSPSVSINDSINPFIIYRLGYKWKVDEKWKVDNNFHDKFKYGNDQDIIALKKSFLMELIDVTIPRPGSLEASEMWRSFFPVQEEDVGFRKIKDENTLKVKSSIDNATEFQINEILPNLRYHMAEQLLMIGEVADESSRSGNKFWKRIKRSYQIWQTDRVNLTELIQHTGLTDGVELDEDDEDSLPSPEAIRKAGNPDKAFMDEIKLYYQTVNKEKKKNVEKVEEIEDKEKCVIDEFIGWSILEIYERQAENLEFKGGKKTIGEVPVEFLRCDQTVFDRLSSDYVNNLKALPFNKVMSIGYVISWPWFLQTNFDLFEELVCYLRTVENHGLKPNEIQPNTIEKGNIKIISVDKWTLKVENNRFNARTCVFDFKGKKVVITATTASPRQLGTTITLRPGIYKPFEGYDLATKGYCDVKFLQRQTNPEVYIRTLHQIGLQVHAYSMVGAVKILKDSLDYRIL